MDQEYLKELETIYQDQMKEIRENLDKEVRAEFQEELNRANAANTQATYWNSMGSNRTGFRQVERDSQNTQAANEARLAEIEKKIQEQVEERSEGISKTIGASVFEDFGGNRDYALSLLEAEEEPKLLTFQEEKEAANEQKETLLIEDQNPQINDRESRIAAQKEKVRWNFDVASGRQEQKQEAIQDQAKDDFNLESGIEVQKHAEQLEILEEVRQDFIREYEMEEEHQEAMEEEQEQTEEEEISVELKAPEKERENTTLDTTYWKQAEQTTAQQDTSSLITTSNHDAQMEARISQSFDRSESREEGISY